MDEVVDDPHGFGPLQAGMQILMKKKKVKRKRLASMIIRVYLS